MIQSGAEALAFQFPQNGWKPFFERESQKEYFVSLSQKVLEAYGANTVYPPLVDVFNAYNYTDFPDVKVVIIGQDPYFNPAQAHGLSFSVKCPTLPPSLLNIYKEMSADLGCAVAKKGDLTGWARQGVMLLNASLSVLAGNANSHAGLGWSYFTANTIAHLNYAPEPIVYILWGKFAQALKKYIDTSRHFCIESAHPSPMAASYGFFGSRPFSRANRALAEWGRPQIDWTCVL